MAKKQELGADEVTPKASSIIRSIRTSLNKDDDEKLTWDLTKEDSPTHVKEFISTGSTLLDYVVSNRRAGGIPVGKLTEIQGEEASGKSLLCAHIIANTQKLGGIAVYMDTENATNPDFMRRVGVDLQSLIYVQPGTIEKAFETIEDVIKALRAKSADIPVTILWDSIAATPPQAEIEGDYDPNSRIGLMAKALAKGLRKLTDLIGRERITLVFTNQLKQKFNVMYGDPWGTPGGKAIPYHASVRLRVSSSTKLKDKDNTVFGIVTNGSAVKTRLGPPLRKCKFEIHFDAGIDDVGSWFNVLHENKLIEKRGGWCYIEMPNHPPVQFREAGWRKLCAENVGVKAWAEQELERIMVVRYDDNVLEREGVEIPSESALDGDEE